MIVRKRKKKTNEDLGGFNNSEGRVIDGQGHGEKMLEKSDEVDTEFKKSANGKWRGKRGTWKINRINRFILRHNGFILLCLITH